MPLRDLMPQGVEITPSSSDATQILTPQAVAFVAKLARKFESQRRSLMTARTRRQSDFDSGKRPDFLPETKRIRDSEWSIGPVPHDLLDRRVEITGPTDRKMVINALNSGANVFMADFEDSNASRWSNMIEGQLNLRDAARRDITYTSPQGKPYRLDLHTSPYTTDALYTGVCASLPLKTLRMYHVTICL